MENKKEPWYKTAFSFIRKCIIFIVGFIYFFVYFASFLLSIISRVFLGIAYFGMGDTLKGKNVFRYMFNK